MGDDLLSRLMLAQHEDGTRMSDRQLRDEVMTLYLAGHETTSLTLSWTWYLLAQHQRVEEKLVSEWQQVLGGRTPTVDQLQQLPYTAAVIAESMRLLPPVYAIGREAIGDLELGGYRVRRGYTVLMSQWVNHRDPEYFPEPQQFRPERWENGLAKRLPKFAYYPFGGGQRMCIGSTFASIEHRLCWRRLGSVTGSQWIPKPISGLSRKLLWSQPMEFPPLYGGDSWGAISAMGHSPPSADLHAPIQLKRTRS